MKRILVILALVACAARAQDQSTIRFKAILTGSNEVPPNSDSTLGTADFWLDGTVLNFYVYIPATSFNMTGGSINGPALRGEIAPLIFDLGGFRYHSGSSFGDPPFYASGSPAVGPVGAGPFSLTGGQIDQLESGLWYVNITSGAKPDGQLRGQILPLFMVNSSVYATNQFQLSVTGVPGYSYILQASTNLTAWTSIQTNTSPFTFTDTAVTNYAYRFYRALYQP